MNQKLYRTGLGLGLALPLFAAGCQDNYRSSNDDWASTNRVAVETRDVTAGRGEANNSARNTADRDHQTLTTGDQGTSQSDQEITRQIRKALTSTDSYSISAKNVKIITVNGRVTLRGPVENNEERAGIGNIAQTVAGGANVDNELEVKSNP